MKRPIKVFEPVTNDQIKKTHSIVRCSGFSKPHLSEMVAGLTGIASLTALSKQEAIFLIDLLQGKSRTRHPARPRFENEISGDTSKLPSFYHIRDIRLIFKELGWDKDHIKNWLIKYRKVRNIRSMDRKQARATYAALQVMVEKKRGTKKDNTKRSTTL